MTDRIALTIAAALLTLLVFRPARADDARDQKAAAERLKATQEARHRQMISLEKAVAEQRLAKQQLQQAVQARPGRMVIEEPEEEFVDEDYGDLRRRERFAAQMPLQHFDNSVFGSQDSREDFSRRQEAILRAKVEALDRGCKLTDSQRLKLVLAGHGDIKHLLDRIDDLRQQFAGIEVTAGAYRLPAELAVAQREIRPLVSTGPFDSNSLFAKIMHSTLTAEQVTSIAAMTEVERQGGRVVWRMQRGKTFCDVNLTATPFTDDGLAKTIGLSNVRLLALEITRVTDAGLAHVAGLKSLEVLDLCGTRITSAGLVHLKELLNLQILMLRNTLVDDASLVHLRGLAKLNELHLQGTRVTDEGLLHLAPLRQLALLNLGRTRITDAGLANLDLPARATLRELGLAHTGITDAGLEQVNVLAGLERLYVNGTQITDAGLAGLGGLRKLQGLYLDDTQITDAGLGHVERLSDLERLDLGGTRVTDAGLARIRGLKMLKHLDLANTRVTDAGVAELQRALPDVVVIR